MTTTEVPTAKSISPRLAARLGAEVLGTFWLVFAGCGSAIFAAKFSSQGTSTGIGFLGVSFAFGLSVLVMAAAVGGVSGGHFNPAVTIGLACARRVEWRLVPPYVIAQIVAATLAGAVLLAIATGRPGGYDATLNGFATNGYGDRSPGGYSLLACLVTEVVLTAIFVAVIIAVTGTNAPTAVAPVVIGLALTLINLVAIPIDNASVNPVRSLGVAWFAGPAALGQVWLFIVAPIVGAAIAGVAFRSISALNLGLGGEGTG